MQKPTYISDVIPHSTLPLNLQTGKSNINSGEVIICTFDCRRVITVWNGMWISNTTVQIHEMRSLSEASRRRWYGTWNHTEQVSQRII